MSDTQHSADVYRHRESTKPHGFRRQFVPIDTITADVAAYITLLVLFKTPCKGRYRTSTPAFWRPSL